MVYHINGGIFIEIQSLTELKGKELGLRPVGIEVAKKLAILYAKREDGKIKATTEEVVAVAIYHTSYVLRGWRVVTQKILRNLFGIKPWRFEKVRKDMIEKITSLPSKVAREEKEEAMKNNRGRYLDVLRYLGAKIN